MNINYHRDQFYYSRIHHDSQEDQKAETLLATIYVAESDDDLARAVKGHATQKPAFRCNEFDCLYRATATQDRQLTYNTSMTPVPGSVLPHPTQSDKAIVRFKNRVEVVAMDKALSALEAMTGMRYNVEGGTPNPKLWSQLPLEKEAFFPSI
jgi:hypothetical protein